MKNKLVCGVGINDSQEVIQKSIMIEKPCGKKVQKRVWTCPYYRLWSNVLTRCYNQKHKEKFPTYIGCTVCEEWKYFSKFKAWMETQAWEGSQLDKDLLFKGNKVYSPNTCVFVPRKVNFFLLECGASRGENPVGVSWCGKNEKYRASVSTPLKRKHLGYFHTKEEAHKAWLTAKLEQAKILSVEILEDGCDPRIARALLDYYENYSQRNTI